MTFSQAVQTLNPVHSMQFRWVQVAWRCFIVGFFVVGVLFM